MIKKGDIVVLMRDDSNNFVPNFERFIGAVGEVVSKYPETSRDVIRVTFDPEESFGHTWYYAVEKLFKLGSTK